MEKKQTRWMKHLMDYKKSHPDISLSDAMKKAKKTYTKEKK